MDPPEADRRIGMLAYSTAGAGSGGSLRCSPGDFVVAEVLRPAALSMISAADDAAAAGGGGRGDGIGGGGNGDGKGGRGKGGGEGEGHAVYIMRKTGIDTAHALARVRARCGLRLKALGLKDAAAETSQYVYSPGRRGPRPARIEAGPVELELAGYSPRPLAGTDMAGNRFTIRVDGAPDSVGAFAEYGRIANYYGYQRFGSARPVSHLVGRALLLGEYGRAVELLLSFESPHDDPKRAELRRMMADPANYARAAKALPRGMDIERTVLEAMIRHGDARRAAASIPTPMRRFLAQAHQSYLFNMAASSLLASGEDVFEARAGDVSYGPDGEPRRHALPPDPPAAPAIPLPGYAHYRKTRFEAAVSAAMERDGTAPRDFLAKGMPEIGLEGGLRSAAVPCSDVESPAGDTVSFTLGRGSYATVVMREIVKPADPHACGF